MALTAKQKRVAYHIVSVGKRKGASRKELISALATALVEANLGNPGHGDRDSVGWRQERSHYGSKGNRMNVRAAAARYFDETRAAGRGRGMTAGQLSQTVQRSAFPGRYDQRKGQAKDVLAYIERSGGGGGGGGRTVTSTTPGIDNSPLRQQLKMAYLAQRHDPDALLNLAQGLQGAEDVPGKTTVKRYGGKPAARGGKRVGSAYEIGKMAQRYGLHVREHPAFDKVDPVHTKGSYHYQRGKKGGRAVDISGDPRQLRRFYAEVTRKYGRNLTEAFHDPAGYYIKHGKKVRGAIGGHGSHAHFAV